MQAARVGFLVGELRSHVQGGQEVKESENVCVDLLSSRCPESRENTVSGVSVRVRVKSVKSTLPRWAGTGKLTGSETLSPDVHPSWLFESAWDVHQRFPWSSGPWVWAELQGQHS